MNLKDYSGQEVINMLDSGDISVLGELGAEDIRDEMKTVGKLCSFYVKLCCLSKNDSNLRRRGAAIIRSAAPAKMEGTLPQRDNTIVIGFNHPSLGEICRLLHIGLKYYPDREFLFPVNLPWYESIVPVLPQLHRLGINITPMITPATEEKLNRKFSDDQQKLDEVQFLKMAFDKKYIRELKNIAEKNGVVFVAPSATRQKEIIGDYVHPSMTVVAHIVMKSNRKATFVPVAVLPPVLTNRELNLFRVYRIIPCESFESEEVKTLTSGRDREFDFSFLKRIEAAYLENKHFPL